MVDPCSTYSNDCNVLLFSSTVIVMLKYVKNKIKKISKLNEEALVEKVFNDHDVQDEIIELNKKQMFEEGIDAKGDSLGEYSKVSVEVYGKRPGRIQLYEEGNFYNSIKVKVGNGEASVTGDMQKQERDLSIQWPDALGLTDESKRKVRVLGKEIIKDNIRSSFNE